MSDLAVIFPIIVDIYHDIIRTYYDNNFYLVVYVSQGLYDEIESSLFKYLFETKRIELIIDPDRKYLEYGYTKKENLISNTYEFFEQN